jgi:transposase
MRARGPPSALATGVRAVTDGALEKKTRKGIDNPETKLIVALVVDLRAEKDIEQLRRVALAQRTQIDLLLRALREMHKDDPEALQQALLKLEEQARKAEEASASTDQTRNTSDRSDERSKSETTKPKKRTSFGNTQQTKLDVEDLVCELDEADKICPCCGGVLHPMKDQFETSEMIDVVEIRYVVKKCKQQKYACACGGVIETAPGPERVIPGSRYSLAFAIHVAIAKYLDHIPLARQERMMRRHGLEITTQTLWDVINALAKRLESANDALMKHALAHPVIGIDQTSWRRLENKDKKPWQMWCITAPGCVVHRIKEDKTANTFVDLVGDFVGTIVCDAASTHTAGIDEAARSRNNDRIVLSGCWAHVFRKFRDASSDHPDANVMMAWIQKLYAIDASADGDRNRLAELRRTESKKVADEMRIWLWSQALLESLSIGKAAAYTIKNWERLLRFLDDPRIPLDNNATERGIRGPVVGRRNHFGSKSKRGTEVAAIFYSLMETAKLVGVDPATYLREAALAHSRGETLLPTDLVR